MGQAYNARGSRETETHVGETMTRGLIAIYEHACTAMLTFLGVDLARPRSALQRQRNA